MNSENRFVEMYVDGADILNKADQLIANGWHEKDIYLLLIDRGDLALLRYQTTVDVKLADGIWQDHFKGFISGERHVKKAMSLQGFFEGDPERYYERIEEGGLLLYADRGELEHYYQENSEFKNAAPETVIWLGATGVIDATPGVSAGCLRYPEKGDSRVALDGQNIRRKGDQVADPAAEEGYDASYYHNR